MAADPGVKVHLYGKAVRPGRKIGHVTVTGDRIDRSGGAGATGPAAPPATCAGARKTGG